MAKLGRFVVDEAGTMLEVDDAFCSTVRMSSDQLIGRNALEITAIADRERCAFLIAQVLADRTSVSTVKRLLRADGTHIWVSNTLEPFRLASGDFGCEVHSADAVAPTDWVDPSVLLRVARFIIAARRARTAAFSAHFFGDAAWDIMILAYVSEAEGRTLGTADLQVAIGIGATSASRWIRALHAEHLIDYEAHGGSKASVTPTIRLSASGHRQLEAYLSALHRAATADHGLELRG